MLAIYHIAMLCKDKKKGVKTAKRHIAGVYIFCFVIVLVLTITSVPGIYHLGVDAKINLTPFAYFPAMYYQYIGNALLFVPVGFLLPFLWKRFGKWYLTLLCGFMFSLSIEFAQLFNNRVTDVDDLLMNTLGTLIGFIVYVIIKSRSAGISMFSIGRANHWKDEPFFCFLFVWISVLVFKPILSVYILELAIPFVAGAPG